MKPLLAVATLLVLPSLGACGAGAGASDRTHVVAAFYPLEYVAQRVAGQHADVATLTSPGTEPHDLELTVQQTAKVANADVVVHAGNLQPAVDETVDQVGEGRVVDAAEAAGSGAGEGSTQPDPHFWLDPVRMASVAAEVKRQLVEADPDHAGAYERNLASLTKDLHDLDADMAAGLRDCGRQTVVVSHDAFGAMERYGLEFVPINGLSPAAEPSPAHLGEVAELIETAGITTVFTETLASPELADTLANDLGLETGVLDPIEGLTEATADEDYLSLMRQNLSAIREANGCR